MEFLEFLKDIVNVLCDPKILISVSAVLLFASLKWPEKFYSDKSAKILFTFMFWGFPTGLVIYWLVNNILSIGQQILYNRQIEAAKAAKA